MGEGGVGGRGEKGGADADIITIILIVVMNGLTDLRLARAGVAAAMRHDTKPRASMRLIEVKRIEGREPKCG